MPDPYFVPPLHEINDEITNRHDLKLFLLRTDLNHPSISGNKLYKLKYNLAEAKRQNKKSLLSFGGAFSNHIAATAFAGKENNFKTIGIIRGDEALELNHTLKSAKENGMEVHFVSRELYRNKNALYEYIHKKFQNEDFYLIPEGGANDLGIQGCKEITQQISIPFDYICCPCGTGTTLTGIILSLKENQQAIGFQVLKSENYIKNEVQNWLKRLDFQESKNWHINENYHFDGYAKTSPKLVNFMERFQQENYIPLDYVYTGKMMFGIYDLIKNNFFKQGTVVIAIHTGGLQGNQGFQS